jgi:hypothetical protein
MESYFFMLIALISSIIYAANRIAGAIYYLVKIMDYKGNHIASKLEQIRDEVKAQIG